MILPLDSLKFQMEVLNENSVTKQPMSLSRLVNEHHAKQATLRRENEQLRKDAIQSVGVFSDAVADTLNSRVSQIFLNQKNLEQEARNLSTQTARYSKQTTQWLNLVEQFDSALKELGDVQNWVQVIQKDMEQVTRQLESKN